MDGPKEFVVFGNLSNNLKAFFRWTGNEEVLTHVAAMLHYESQGQFDLTQRYSEAEVNLLLKWDFIKIDGLFDWPAFVKQYAKKNGNDDMVNSLYRGGIHEYMRCD